MHMKSSIHLTLLLSLLSAGAIADSQIYDDSAQYTDRNVDIICNQHDKDIRCDLRPLAGNNSELITPTITVEGQHLPAAVNEKFADSASPHSAVIFLVDSSDPRRQKVVQSIAAQIRAMATAANPGTMLGLAAFDKGMRILAPPDLDRQIVIAASHELQAKGKVTELYRSTIEAINILLEIPVQRRAVYIFSDGLAEDTAYTIEATIARAQQHGILIYGFGYARTASAVVGLQTLRRLSEESNGNFVEAGLDASLADEVLTESMRYVTAGSITTWDLSPIIETPGERHSSAEVSIKIGNKSIGMDLPLLLEQRLEPILEEPEPEPPAPAPIVITVPAVDEEVAEIQETSNRTMIMLSLSVLLLILALVLLVSRVLSKKDKQPVMLPPPVTPAPAAYAHIQNVANESDIVTINCTPWRMGRSSYNDYTINDSSVSRSHAEITYLGANKFKITDLGSSNGLLLNNKRIETAALNDGDIMEVGEIQLRFMLHPPDEKDQDEATVFAETRMDNE